MQTPMQNRSREIEPALVAGAALYWAAIVLQFIFATRQDEDGLGWFLESSASRYILLSAFVGVGLVAHGLLSTARGRAGTILTACLTTTLALILMTPGTSEFLGGVPRLVIHLLAIAILMVMWAFALASMDKRQAGVNVACALLVTALLVIGASLLPSPRLRDIAGNALMAVSAFVLASGRIRFCNHSRSAGSDRTRAYGWFIASRTAFGLTMGWSIEAARTLTPLISSIPLAIIALGIVIAALTVLVHSPEQLYTLLPALLFLSIGTTYLPFFEDGLASTVEAAAGILWLTWAGFSGLQLSDLKERCGTNEAILCLIEKLVLCVSIILGILVWHGTETLLPQIVDVTSSYVLFGVICIMILATAYCMSNLIGARKEDAVREQMLREQQEHLANGYSRIAEEYHLSAREREVMEMLAEGYTRTYIKNVLGVSDGTVKAHTAHIYQKLGIHRKDDLLEYVEKHLERW